MFFGAPIHNSLGRTPATEKPFFLVYFVFLFTFSVFKQVGKQAGKQASKPTLTIRAIFHKKIIHYTSCPEN